MGSQTRGSAILKPAYVVNHDVSESAWPPAALYDKVRLNKPRTEEHFGKLTAVLGQGVVRRLDGLHPGAGRNLGTPKDSAPRRR